MLCLVRKVFSCKLLDLCELCSRHSHTFSPLQLHTLPALVAHEHLCNTYMWRTSLQFMTKHPRYNSVGPFNLDLRKAAEKHKCCTQVQIPTPPFTLPPTTCTGKANCSGSANRVWHACRQALWNKTQEASLFSQTGALF